MTIMECGAALDVLCRFGVLVLKPLREGFALCVAAGASRRLEPVPPSTGLKCHPAFRRRRPDRPPVADHTGAISSGLSSSSPLTVATGGRVQKCSILSEVIDGGAVARIGNSSSISIYRSVGAAPGSFQGLRTFKAKM